jgi:Histone deacetylase domain.
MAMATERSVFIYSEEELQYHFGPHHPFNQMRLLLTKELLEALGALSPEQLIPPRMARDEELELVLDPDFIRAVKKAGKGELSGIGAEIFGLGTEDTPIFPNMHEASARLVGGTLVAVETVMEGKARHALHLGGGLHHGLRGKASGFCIYNDCSVAIQYIRKHYEAKVLYIDTDAHHGDGVQWAFYEDPHVCTLSFHETGRYLFPGTGSIHERGSGSGYGYSFNIPLDAFTEDDSWLEVYREAALKVADYFRPDVILTQNGTDAHFWDPLTHLSTTIRIYREIPKLAHEIAHTYAGGRWVAVGGGGYDIWRVVPRAWAMIWLEMTGQRNLATGSLPEKWIEKWQSAAPVSLPREWDDPEGLYPAIPRKHEIREKNFRTLKQALRELMTPDMK